VNADQILYLYKDLCLNPSTFEPWITLGLDYIKTYGNPGFQRLMIRTLETVFHYFEAVLEIWKQAHNRTFC
jgi:hypothetical protein